MTYIGKAHTYENCLEHLPEATPGRYEAGDVYTCDMCAKPFWVRQYVEMGLLFGRHEMVYFWEGYKGHVVTDSV